MGWQITKKPVQAFILFVSQIYQLLTDEEPYFDWILY